jgi:predicted enzyme related to lactoylglutathione lyase
VYLENVVMDALEPQRLGRFWEAALGSERLTDEPSAFETRIRFGDAFLDLCLPRVPEPVTEAPRLHLDLLGGSGQGEVVARLLELGAQHLDIGQGDVPWVVLADPEGNAFCVMEERAAYTDTGPIAALPLHSSDPERDAEFWSWLTGWVDAPGIAPRTLRHPSLRGPLLEISPESAPKGPTKNRVHLDVRLEPGEDADDVETAITARGGRRLEVDWGDLPWRTYLDPSGNEFCVLRASSAG